MWRTDSLERTLMLRKTEGKSCRGWQRMRWLDGITDSMDMSLSKLWERWWTGKPGMLQSMGSHRVRHNWATKLNSAHSCQEGTLEGNQEDAEERGQLSSDCFRLLSTSQVALEVKNLPANAGDMRGAGSIPGSERSPGGGHDIPLQYSCLQNPKDRGAWRATVHRVTKSHTQLKRLNTHARSQLHSSNGAPPL